MFFLVWSKGPLVKILEENEKICHLTLIVDSDQLFSWGYIIRLTQTTLFFFYYVLHNNNNLCVSDLHIFKQKMMPPTLNQWRFTFYEIHYGRPTAESCFTLSPYTKRQLLLKILTTKWFNKWTSLLWFLSVNAMARCKSYLSVYKISTLRLHVNTTRL